ncbi:MAG: tetratricopeptide repeat protein, partial [Gemmatimonadota bacterium]
MSAARRAGMLPLTRRLGGPALLVSVAAMTLALTPDALRAQEESAFSKSELIRLVVSDTYSDAEKASIIRASCLSFVPTAGDWRDLRTLGAAATVVGAVEDCTAGRLLAVEATLEPQALRVTAGQAASLTVSLQRGGSPVANAEVRVISSNAGLTGGRGEWVASTDGQGRVSLRIAAGRRTGSTTVRVLTDGLETPAAARFVVRAGSPASGLLTPDTLVVEPTLAGAEAASKPVVVQVTDRFGNAVPGVRVTLEADPGSGPDDGSLPGPLTATTSGSGEAVFDLPVEVTAWTGWTVRSGSTELASLEVRVIAPEPAAPADVATAVANLLAGGAEGDEPADGEIAPDDLAGGNLAGRDQPLGPNANEIDRRLRLGDQALADGDAQVAAAHYLAALSYQPRNVTAQRGLARSYVQSGDSDQAVVWYQAATSQSPSNAEIWDELSQALAAAGRSADARQARAQATALDPVRYPEADEVELATSTPRQRRGWFEAYLWGGNTFDNGREAGVRSAGIRGAPSPNVELWAGFDNALNLSLTRAALVRGRDDVESFFGGTRIQWGPGKKLFSLLEIGRRNQGAGFGQNTYRAEQGFKLSNKTTAASLSFGGFFGRWFDRDDWQGYARLSVPTSPAVTVSSVLIVGETIGSNSEETGRRADKDTRFYLSIGYQSPSGFGFTPSLGVGQVTSEFSQFGGTISDLSVRVD